LKGMEKQRAGFKFGKHRTEVIEEYGCVEHKGRKYKFVRVKTQEGLEYVAMRLYNAGGKFIKQLMIEPCLCEEFSQVLGSIPK
jgi:hypothetical protein